LYQGIQSHFIDTMSGSVASLCDARILTDR